NIKAIREKLHLSQKQFAETFGLSLSVVRDWEQGRFFPDRAARTLLKVIAHNPQAVQEALAHPNERGSRVDNPQQNRSTGRKSYGLWSRMRKGPNWSTSPRPWG